MNNEESINDALKRLQLGQHESKSPEQALMDKIHAVNLRVAELCKQTWKDKSPTKDEFAQLLAKPTNTSWARHSPVKSGSTTSPPCVWKLPSSQSTTDERQNAGNCRTGPRSL